MNRTVILTTIVILSTQASASPISPKNISKELQVTLKKIDSLHGYGSITHMYGLEFYIAFIESILCNQMSSEKDLQNAYDIAEAICSRYAYRDGSYRSRIYSKAQQAILTSLTQYAKGKIFLTKLVKSCPVITELLS